MLIGSTGWLALALAGQPSTVVAAQDDALTVAGTLDLLPGQVVGLYLPEPRPDPRTGALVVGLRYAGDARVQWRAEQLLVLVPHHRLELPSGHEVHLGEPQGAAPTAAWRPPGDGGEGQDGALEQGGAPDEAPVVAVRAPTPEPLRALQRTTGGEALPAVAAAWAERYGARSQGIRAHGGWLDDGHGSGVGGWGLSWWTVPSTGLARIELGLEGLRGRRWILQGATGQDEGAGLEPAVGYWIVGELESAAPGLAVIGGLAVGVDDEGLSPGGALGLRLGLPHADRIVVRYDVRGDLGSRLTLDGRIAASDALRIGLRSRVGDIPRHQGDPVQQARADGALLIAVDASASLGLTLAGGLAAYDLLLADAGPVLDATLEVRW